MSEKGIVVISRLPGQSVWNIVPVEDIKTFDVAQYERFYGTGVQFKLIESKNVQEDYEKLKETLKPHHLSNELYTGINLTKVYEEVQKQTGIDGKNDLRKLLTKKDKPRNTKQKEKSKDVKEKSKDVKEKKKKDVNPKDSQKSKNSRNKPKKDKTDDDKTDADTNDENAKSDDEKSHKQSDSDVDKKETKDSDSDNERKNHTDNETNKETNDDSNSNSDDEKAKKLQAKLKGRCPKTRNAKESEKQKPAEKRKK